MKRIFTLFVLQYVFIGFTFALASNTSPLSSAGITFSPGIHLPQEYFNLGRIAIGTEKIQNVEVHNTGTSPLIIKELLFSFSGVRALNDFPLEIAAGSSAILQLSFQPTEKGEKRGDVEIISNDPYGKSNFGIAASYYAINEIRINHGRVAFSKRLPLKIHLRNTERLATFQFDIDLPDKFVYVAGSGKLLGIDTDHLVQASQENRRLRINVFSPSSQELPPLNQDLIQLDIQVDAGPGNHWLNLWNAVGSSLQEDILFSGMNGGSVVVTAPLIQALQEVDLGTMVLGEEKDISLKIQNSGGEMLILHEAFMDMPGLALTDVLPKNIFPTGNLDLTLNFKPQDVGNYSGHLLLKNNSYNDHEFLINFSAKVIASDTVGIEYPSILSIINIEGFKSDVSQTEVIYEFNQEVADIQFDLIISPENGLNFGQVELGEAIQLTHQLSTSALGNGRYRILIRSAENNVIPKGKGILLKLPLDIGEVGKYEISLSEKIVTNPTGADIEVGDVAGQIIIHKDPKPTITIEASTPTFDHEGQSIRYNITISNETAVALQNIEIKDKLTGIDLIRNLNPGEKSMLSGEYKVTQEDLIRGYISNAAVAIYNGLTYESNEIRIEAIIDINLTLSKRAMKERFTSIGEEIIYELVVLNNGNLPMENIRVIDSLTGFDQTIKEIGPGGEMVMFIFFHLVTEADIERGYVSGTAYALWEDKKFRSEEIRVTYVSQEELHPIITGPAELVLERVFVRQKKDFSIMVKNEGFQNLILHAIKSNLPGIQSLQSFPIEVKPGDSIELFFEITPTVAGELTGELQIKNNSVNAFEFSVRVGANVLEENNLVVTSHEGTLEEFGTIDLMYEFKEDVSSLQFDLFISPAEGLKLGKAQLDEAISKTHQLSTSSLGNGLYRFLILSFDNRMIPIGKGMLLNFHLEKLEVGSYEISISNETVFSSSGSELGVEVGAGQVIIHANSGPTISIESNTPTFDYEGQKISYTITLSNESAVALQNIRILDILTDLDLNLNLNPGQQEVLTREYLVKQEDLLRGYISNSAAAVYNGRKYETNDIRIEAVLDVSLTVNIKSLTESYSNVGEEIPYELVVMNSSNILLENIRIIDSLTSFEQIIEKLSPGEEVKFNLIYSVSEADVDRGYVVSKAYALWEKKEFNSQEVRVAYVAEEESHPLISGPAELVLKDVFVLQKKGFSILIENSGTGEMILEGLKTDLSNLQSLQTFPITIKSGASLELLFEITPQAVGTLSGEIQIKNNSQNNPEFSVRIGANVLKENHLTVNSIEGKVNEISNVTIDYDFTTDVSALQFDLQIEPNIALDLTKVQLSETIKNTHQVSASKLSEGKYRLLVFSLQNALILSRMGILMEVPLKPLEPGSYKMQLENVTLSSAAGMDLPFEKTDGLLFVTGEPVTHPVDLEVGIVADKNSFSEVGEEVVFNLSIKNRGKGIVKQIKAVDQLIQDLTEINELEPGAVYEWTKTYTITQGDVDKAVISNSVKATVGDTEFWSNELNIKYVEPGNPLLLAEKDIYLPTKFINQQYKISIPIKNGGTVPLSINDILVEFPYLQLQENLPIAIEPGVSRDIKFSYEPKETGTFTDTVRLVSNSAEPAAWKIALHSKVVGANKLWVESAKRNGREAGIDLKYNFSADVAALQFDLSISSNPDIDLEKLFLSESIAIHHDLSVSKIGEGKYRFLIFSLQYRLISGGEGLLLTIPLDSKITAQYRVDFEQVMISSEEGEMPVETSGETIEVQDPIMSLDINHEYRNHVFLHQNYPNPFVRETAIKISLPKGMSVKLSVYNMDGREVAVLIDGYLKGGDHELIFDGDFLAKGVYFYQLQVDNMVFYKKMIKN